MSRLTPTAMTLDQGWSAVGDETRFHPSAKGGPAVFPSPVFLIGGLQDPPGTSERESPSETPLCVLAGRTTALARLSDPFSAQC